MKNNGIDIKFNPSAKQSEAWQYLTDNETDFVGYGGSAFCFTGDTLVNTIRGHKPIKYIMPGELVLSESATGKMEYQPVVFKHKNSRDAKRKFITFVLSNTRIKSTYQHEYRFNGSWVSALGIAIRIMAVRGKHGQSVFNQQYGQIIDNWLQEQQKDYHYEAGSGSIWLHENFYFTEQENNSYKNSQTSSEGVHNSGSREVGGQSQELQHVRQSNREFGMGDEAREYETFRRCKEACLVGNIAASNEGRRQPYGQTKRIPGKGNKKEIFTPKIHTPDVSQRIRSEGLHDKGYNSGSVMEAREIVVEEITDIIFTTENIETYDLTVLKNQNYVVSSENIKVHNSGKSYLECYWLTIMCIAYPGTGWFLGRSTLTTLKDTVLKTLFKVFGECGITDHRDYKLNSQTNIIRFTNGSEIFLLDLAAAPSDPLYTWLGGYEFTGGAIDESAECTPGVIDILASRIGRRLNEKYKLRAKILETFNPTKNHVYVRYYFPWKNGTLKKEYKFVKALPQDNPSPEVVAWLDRMLKGNDETTKQRLVYGNFDYDDDPARLIDNVKAMEIFTNSHVPEGKKCVTADIARLGGDRIVIIEWNGMRGKVTAFDRKLLTVSTTAIEAARIRTGCGKSDVIVDSDGMGSGVEDFGGFKGFVNNSRPLPDPLKPMDANGKRAPENFDMLKSQCGFRMAEIINANGLYLECEEWMKELIIQELGQVKQKLLNSDMKKGLLPKEKVKEALGRSPDFFDAIMMRAWFELRPGFVLTATSLNKAS